MKKIASTVLACAVAASLAGCTIKSPETVGSIGDTEFTAGTYLLAQYSAVNSLMNLAEDSSSVKEALKSEVTAEDGETMQGSEFVEKETLENLQYTAGLEAAVAERGLTLTDDELEQVDTLTEQIMSYYENVYAQNGIGEKTIRETYQRNLLYSDLFDAVYGEGGEREVSDADKQTWLDENAVAGDVIVLPLTNTDDSTYEVSDEAEDAVRELAQTAADELAGGADLQETASAALAAAYGQLGMEYSEEDDLSANISNLMIMPSELTYYGTDFETAVGEMTVGEASVIDRGTSLWVFLKKNAGDVKTLEEVEGSYDLVSLMKSEDFTAELTAAGAAMENDLDSSAMSAYKAENIKLS